jgi:hypothetical protein
MGNNRYTAVTMDERVNMLNTTDEQVGVYSCDNCGATATLPEFQRKWLMILDRSAFILWDRKKHYCSAECLRSNIAIE